MTTRSPELLEAMCNKHAQGLLAYEDLGRYFGVPHSTLWSWIKASNNGDEKFLIEYLGERMQFAKALGQARKLALYEVRGRLEQKSLRGYDEPVFFQGQPTYKRDTRCLDIDDPDIREMLGFSRDGYLRGADGLPVQNTVHHEPPV